MKQPPYFDALALQVAISADNACSFEAMRLGAQRTEVEIERESGERLRLLNFASYNYLG